MEGLTDTTVTYSRFSNYLQPYSQTLSLPGTPVSYISATARPSVSSTHQLPFADEPRLGITPAPSPHSSSSDQDDNHGDSAHTVPFRSVDYGGVTVGMCSSSMPLTPSESPRSGSLRSDRCSSNEDDRSGVPLLVQIPRHYCQVHVPVPPAIEPAEQNRTNGASTSSPNPAPASPAPAHGITVNMLDEKLWQSFKAVGNEMIVTKPGRRLFPALLVNIRGLDQHTDYTISLRISSADPYRYKFLNMQWVSVGESEIMQNEDRQIYCHYNSPSTGQFWMKKPISFKSVKITHNPTSKHGNILLHTMHKYVMELVLEPTGQPAITIPIPDTEFMAVTAYQNGKITQLKIDNNPFAKGFRDRESAGFHHPSTMFSPPYSLPSLYSFSSGQTPLWHQMPQLACQIPPIPIREGSESPENRSTVNNLPALPAYPQSAIPPNLGYPYFPPSSWPTAVYPNPDSS